MVVLSGPMISLHIVLNGVAGIGYFFSGIGFAIPLALMQRSQLSHNFSIICRSFRLKKFRVNNFRVRSRPLCPANRSRCVSLKASSIKTSGSYKTMPIYKRRINDVSFNPLPILSRIV